MARINIEEECFSRLGRLTDLLGVEAREALGTLAFLWHDSQDILKTHGSLEDILDWCRLTKTPKDTQDLWINSLCKARFLSKVDADLFLIHGNHVQIDNRLKHYEKSKKGADATRKKWEEFRANNEGHRKATGTPQAHQGHAPTTLKTKQNKTNQNKTNQNTTKQSNEEGGQPNSEELASLVFPPELESCNHLWLARGVKPKQLETMLQAFPDPSFILGEAKKAVAWEEANPQRRKKDFARFLNNWLARAWDSRRVLPTKRNEAEEREALNRAAAKEALRLMGVEE
jgi:hypothetical protein